MATLAIQAASNQGGYRLRPSPSVRGTAESVASDLLDNSGTLGTGRRLSKARANEVLRGFSADVWLANGDRRRSQARSCTHYI